ncbi:hypothetical protein PAPYR_4708 [Paratrimastix pyriformis]|uniref:Uncharacterized protein n=1 Tax=Paratrimastix pyriformis TaxID=342808 RepID=A0ABQ8UJJ1_9EUKA|nr:hypothetical protein PAPYR_4708 [Paratrimastix pyriformis]
MNLEAKALLRVVEAECDKRRQQGRLATPTTDPTSPSPATAPPLAQKSWAQKTLEAKELLRVVEAECDKRRQQGRLATPTTDDPTSPSPAPKSWAQVSHPEMEEPGTDRFFAPRTQMNLEAKALLRVVEAECDKRRQQGRLATPTTDDPTSPSPAPKSWAQVSHPEMEEPRD